MTAQDLAKNDVREEVWEKDGVWYAKVSSDYEDEGDIEGGGYYYKRSQSQTLRSFDTEAAARSWVEQKVLRAVTDPRIERLPAAT